MAQYGRGSFFPMRGSSISTYGRLESPQTEADEQAESTYPTAEELLSQIPHPPSSMWLSSKSRAHASPAAIVPPPPTNGPKGTITTTSTKPTTTTTKTISEGDSCDSSLDRYQSLASNTSSEDSALRDCSSSALDGGLFHDKHAIKLFVLLVLCLQNSLFTVLRRYSHGVLKETASKYEVLLVGELIKIVFSAWMIHGTFKSDSFGDYQQHLIYVASSGGKMVMLAIVYGLMNILSFVSLRNIGAGMFTIFAQCKILTTATFSTLLLGRRYSATKWRALVGLMFGVLLFSEPIWGEELKHFSDNTESIEGDDASNTRQRVQHAIGILAVLAEVTMSGFASIYFEKVVKTDTVNMNVWERNFQLAVASCPIYLMFIMAEQGGAAGQIGGGWSWITVIVSLLGAAGGLLVALSIKYGDAILKTLATTGAIILSSLLDRLCLGGRLTPVMVIAGFQVVLAICDYTFDKTPQDEESSSKVHHKNNTRCLSESAPERPAKSTVPAPVKRNTKMNQRSMSATRTVRRNQSAFSRIMPAFPANDEESGLVLPPRK